jgi:hypothetical protein
MTETTQTVATLAAGAVAPFIVQLIKVQLGWHDFKAFALSVVGSFLLALGVMAYTGEITELRAVATNLPAVFGVATLIFKTWSLAMKQPTTTEPINESF